MSYPVTTRVHAWHLNIGVGDCTVFVESDTKGDTNAITSIVLIDGGQTQSIGGLGGSRIRNWLKEDAAPWYMYYWPETQVQLPMQFTSLVITHWDNDHYGGVLDILANDIQTTINTTGFDPATIPNIRISFLKYDTHRNPLSTLYVPYINEAQALGGGTAAKGPPSQFQFETVGTQTFLSFDASASLSAAVRVVVRKVCLVVFGRDTLGINLFACTRSPLSADGYGGPIHLADKYREDVGKGPQNPGLFIIAANGESFVRSSSSSSTVRATGSAPRTHPVLRVVDRPTRANDAGHATNAASIFTALVYPSSDKYKNGSVTHLLAGDALWEMENQVANWIHPEEVKTMKLSHHGSAYSTPTSILSRTDNYNPMNIIVSAGNRHNHPSWQVLFWLYVWSIKAKNRRFLWPTSFPYWLVKGEDDTVANIDPDDFVQASDNTTPKWKFQQEFSAAWKQARLADADNWFLRFNKLQGSQQIPLDRARQKFIVDMMLVAWQHMSNLTREQILASQSSASSGTRTVLTEDDEVSYVLVYSDVNSEIPDGYAVSVTRRQLVEEKLEYVAFRQMGKKGASKIKSDYNTRSRPHPDLDTTVQSSGTMAHQSASSDDIVMRMSTMLRRTDGNDSTSAARVEADGGGDGGDDEDGQIQLQTFGDGFYICSTAIAIPQGTSPDKYFQAAKPSDLNKFLFVLHGGLLSLTARPGSSGKAPLNPDATNGDEWLQWLITSVGVSFVDVYSNAADLEGFGFTFSKPQTMYFTTKEIPASVSKFSSAAPDAFGFIPGPDLLLLGLDSTSVAATARWTLSDVLTFLNMDPGQVGALAGLVGLTLDTKSPDARNAIWVRPGFDYYTAIRLQFTIDDSDKKLLQDFVAAAFDSQMTVSDLQVVAKKVVTYSSKDATTYETDPQPVLILSATVSSPQLGSSLTGHIIPEATGVTTLILEPGNGTFSDILDWLFLLVHAPFKGSDIVGWLPKGSHQPMLRQVRIVSRGSSMDLFSVTVEMGADFGESEDGNVAFFLMYTWRRSRIPDKSSTGTSTFRGNLWCPLTIQDDTITRVNPAIMPEYESFDALTPTTTNLMKYITLSDLVPGAFFKDPPSELDLTVSSLALQISSEEVVFTGGLVAKPADPKDSEPVGFRLRAVDLYVSHVPALNSWSVGFNISIGIQGTQPTDRATLIGGIQYRSETSTWDLSASIQRLKVSTLLSFFPGTDGSAVMSIMDHIDIRQLDVQYTYAGGAFKEFHVYGAMVFDYVELQMDFHRVADQGWKLAAKLTAAPGEDTSLLKLLRGLIKDSSIVDDIPSFLDVPLSSAESVQAGNGLELLVEKVSVQNKEKKSVDYVVFTMSLVLSDFELSFVQIKKSSADDGETSPPPKRLVQVSIRDMAFSQAHHIPIIGDIKQPYDELDFVWVHDEAGLGFNRVDINLVNGLPGFAGVKVKDTVSPANQADDNILLAAGCHFIVASDSSSTGAVPALDYVFGRHKSNPPAPSFKAVVRDDTDSTPTDGGTTMGKMDKTQGPLSIKNIGLRFENSTLHVILDADVKLGVFEFALSGFQISFAFPPGVTLRKLSGITPSVDLAGMALSFNEPAMQVAGLFLNKSTSDVVKFVGGVVLTMDPYSFVAVGGYAEHAAFKSVFLFAELDGPLIELEFAEIDGICAGFGYNSALRLPVLETVEDFPLVNRSFQPAPADPMDVLAKFTKDGSWITDQEGPLWVAAGLKVKAFQCIDVDAVVTLEFNPSLSLAIVALGRAMMPDEPGVTKNDAFLYVEFGLLAVVDVARGTMIIEGALAPNSFVLDPFCHLGGGFALCYWFAGSGHEGDWVFSVGGYHPAYTIPDHYPRPDRLSISWDLGYGLSITGTAFFAVTPKVCMGGGSLYASLSAGPLGAYFSAYAQFLINYSPFHFLGEVGVSVGVSFTLDLWIVTIHINVDISARLTLWGPPFAGSVYVDFWVFGFTVGFGPDAVKRDPLTLHAFYQLLVKSDPGAKTKAIASTAAQPSNALPPAPKAASDHVLSVVSGRYSGTHTDVHSPEGAVWVVRRGGFKFSVQARFAISSMKCNDDAAVPSTAKSKIYSRPMHLTDGSDHTSPDLPITSTLTVTIADKETGTKPNFSQTQILKDVPAALWGAYDSAADPSGGSDPSSSPLLNNNDKTIPLTMGIVFQAPPPVLSQDPIKDFNALAAMSRDVFAAGEDPSIPPLPVSAADTWLPAPKTSGGEADQDWKDVSVAWLAPKIDAADVATAVQVLSTVFGYAALSPAAPSREAGLAGVEMGFLGAPFLVAA